MTPLDRLRLEKAAADCGFEMTPTESDGCLELRSAHFPESVVVRCVGVAAFEVAVSSLFMLDAPEATQGVMVHGYEALYDTLRMAAVRGRTQPNRVADTFRRETADLPRCTEAERLVVQRVGQNLFRAALLDYWQGRCCVTGLDVPELLRASHIKPWAACDSDDERLDVFNGLLLAPQFDALFDAGWMTVESGGSVRLSGRLSPQARATLGVNVPMTIGRLRPEHESYFFFHRRNVFRD